MKKFMILTVLALGMMVVTMGCLVQENTKYVCPDGSIVENISFCPADRFRETRYVCPDGTITEDPTQCTLQYICLNGSIVSEPGDCGVAIIPDKYESEEYWSKQAGPFQIIDYRIAGSAVFFTMRNSGDEELDIKETRFEGTLVRLGFTDTVFAPGEEKPVSGNIVGGSCGEEGAEYSYTVSLKYDNLDSGDNDLQQMGDKPLKGNCEALPNAALSVSCTGATSETNGTIIIKNDGIETVPPNSLNVLIGSSTTRIDHNALVPSASIQVTSDLLEKSMISGVRGEAWMTGGSHISFVCLP